MISTLSFKRHWESEKELATAGQASGLETLSPPFRSESGLLFLPCSAPLRARADNLWLAFSNFLAFSMVSQVVKFANAGFFVTLFGSGLGVDCGLWREDCMARI